MDGESVYPDLHDATSDPEVLQQDTVRFELLEHFGALVTESSHHASEYLPSFRADPDLIEEFAGTGWAGRMETASYLEGWTVRSERRDEGIDLDELTIERSEEYAARIVHSIETGEPSRLNLNVRNDAGAVANLADDSVVEDPA